ncbi:hypothetical protein BKA56DRAFT_503580 [Ilyonectria sp. MPI-CAGE-AT-0026]|nr:hypothetical protein BKA56DRAFT_503580 [Ilyonectria sp. MPI-CAGE-AT-0026]
MEANDKCVLRRSTNGSTLPSKSRHSNAKKNPIVIGNEDSNAYSKDIKLDRFPEYNYLPEEGDDTQLCRIPDCYDCCAATEVSTVHTDCLDFVTSKYKLDNHWSKHGLNYWDHLWVLSAWRTPWRQAPNFRLEEKTFTPNFSMFDNLGYPLMKMKSLPLELIHTIHGFSATSPLWRFTAASAFPHRLPAAPSDQLLTIHLSTLLSWDRGCQPVIADIGDDTISRLPIVRITIDAWGIKKVERLPEEPSFTTWRTNAHVYVVLHRLYLGGTIAHFKFGLLRLKVPHSGLKTWDTPTPPGGAGCRFYPQNITDHTQFRTIDLTKVTGITFFFADGKIYAIHPHTRQTPCAQSTYQQRLSPHLQTVVTWVYFPISKNDSVDTLGVRMLPATGGYVFRMKLAGDIPVGLDRSRDVRDVFLAQSPLTLIHDTRDTLPVSTIGAYSTEKDITSWVTPFCSPSIGEAPFQDALFSSAPLERVRCLSIFNHRETGFCVGILLEYDNGAQRSLGQCRLGVDLVEYSTRPARICFRRDTYDVGPEHSIASHMLLGYPTSRQVTMVKSTGTDEHTHDEEDWTCVPMEGELEFWFSDTQTRLTASAEPEHQDQSHPEPGYGGRFAFSFSH